MTRVSHVFHSVHNVKELSKNICASGSKVGYEHRYQQNMLQDKQKLMVYHISELGSGIKEGGRGAIIDIGGAIFTF